jgi:hypothetical protein
MSVIDAGARWRNRDRTFERAIGRHFAVGGGWLLLIVVLFLEHVVTRDNPIAPLAALGTVGAWLFGLVMLWRWFGGGKILLGFWLWLLSLGLTGSVIVIAMIARELLGRMAPSAQLADVVLAVVLTGLFFLCWLGLKKAERNLP